MGFGEVLKQIRKKNGDSLRKLEEKINISYGYINQIEKSDRPVNENFFKKVIEVYPEDKDVLEKAYIEEVVSDDLIKNIVKNNNLKTDDISENDDYNKLIKLMLSDMDTVIKKEILKYMLTQRENISYKNGTYEKDKKMLEEIKKEIENL